MDYLRFVAALSVIFFHYCSNGILSGKISSIDNFGLLSVISEYGYLGVDLFFIISGFVILYSVENKTADGFANARFVRLYPAYIACMTITALATAIWGNGVSLMQYLANLSMVASYLGYQNMDGTYWTLALELTFYAMVLIIFLIGQEGRLEKIVSAWIVLMMIFRIFSFNLPLFSGYFPLFAAGSLFAFIYKQGYSWMRVTLLAIVFLLSLDGAIDRASSIDARKFRESNDYITSGITATFFLIFILFRNFRARLPASKTVGALTYPIYLLHANIGYLILSNFGSNEHRWMALIGTISVILIGGWMIHHFVERLPKKYWNQLADRSIGTIIRLIAGVRKKFYKYQLGK